MAASHADPASEITRLKRLGVLEYYDEIAQRIRRNRKEEAARKQARRK